jgi:DsbC/DsbD-like thiol-disulfide interchange protein
MHPRLTTPLVAALLLLAAASSLRAQLDTTPTTPLVRARLLADALSIQPGSTFTLAVEFTIADDWHIYWHNPGDAGLATQVTFNLPPGLHADDLRWPAPHRFSAPGEIDAFGYKSRVFLLATVHVDPDFHSDKPVDLAADVSWLVCNKLCLPGQTTVHLQLPVGTAHASPDADQLARWAARAPVLAAASPLVADVHTTGRLGESFIVKVHWAQDVTPVDWFPYALANINVSDVRIMTDDKTTTIQFAAKPFASTHPTDLVLPSVLTWRDAAGDLRSIRIDVPLKTSQP